MQASEGTILVDGDRVRQGPNSMIGFLPESLEMPQHSTVLEFLTLFCALRGVHLQWAHRQIDVILKMFNMKEKKRRYETLTQTRPTTVNTVPTSMPILTNPKSLLIS